MDAHRQGQFVRVSCRWCRITRNYRPLDLYKLIGDCHVLKLQHRFRCEKCERKGYIEVEFKMIIGSEIKGFKVRELAEIKMVKRPVWRDIEL
jgi:hypothetical protein